ncbi:MAG: hypothetical protein J6A79_18010 [Clostridia bacterium]|nr:hypothetical protein [Clostridia bacterium]
METKKKKESGYEPSADPNFDDFGVWLAHREREKAKTQKKPAAKDQKPGDNIYRDQTKRMITDQQRKKRSAK